MRWLTSLFISWFLGLEAHDLMDEHIMYDFKHSVAWVCRWIIYVINNNFFNMGCFNRAQVQRQLKLWPPWSLHDKARNHITNSHIITQHQRNTLSVNEIPMRPGVKWNQRLGVRHPRHGILGFLKQTLKYKWNVINYLLTCIK